MSALSACLLGWVAFSPVVAPVPPEARPDPLARAAIGIMAEENSLIIKEVYPLMPAGKAGLHVGDRLLRIGSLHPNEFKQVLTHICSYRPGAIIEVEVERGSERKVFKMKLVARPPEFDNPGLNRVPPIFLDD